MKFFQCNLDIKNVAETIKYLGRQEDSEFKENNRELKNFAFRFVLDHFFTIYENDKGKVQISQDFLLKNIEMDTISPLAHFVSFCHKLPEDVRSYLEDIDRRRLFEDEDESEDSSDSDSDEDELREEAIPERKILFEERILQLREAAFGFAHENAKAILTNGVSEDFLIDFTFNSLFMSQLESDIAFKVQDQLIPAHKQFLLKKSRYFKNVFNSGMAESRRDVIDIQDCEYDIFKGKKRITFIEITLLLEYLRFTYQETVNLENSNQTIKVHALADKYLQEDLCEECVNFLSKNIKEDNVYKILDFAHEKDIPVLKNCCMEYFKNHLNIKNADQLIDYLGRQEDPEFKENNREFRNFAFGFVLDYFFDLENEREKLQIYESFLLRNIEMDTIPCLVRFLDRSYRLPGKEKHPQEDASEDSSDEDDVILKRFSMRPRVPKTKDLFDERTVQLKEAAFSFIHENMKTILTRENSEGFSKDFLRDFTFHLVEKTSNQIQNLMLKVNQTEISQEENEEKKKRNGKKRIEPVRNGLDEENPMLKKTKKSDSWY